MIGSQSGVKENGPAFFSVCSSVKRHVTRTEPKLRKGFVGALDVVQGDFTRLTCVGEIQCIGEIHAAPHLVSTIIYTKQNVRNICSGICL